MNRFIYVLVIGVSLYISALATADTYTCKISGTVSGMALGFIIDGEVIDGDGIISCVNREDGRESRRVELPVHLTLAGLGVGFDFTIIKSVELVADGIDEVRNPRDLLGEFNVGASAGVTLIDRGYNVVSAISVKHRGNGIGFEVGFMGERAIGLGARVNGFVFRVKAL